ncbi:hypothetical protein NG895_08830 [Aeoliella sp. ICT_H6.2]|uniref:Zinc-finger domain-containing protein n=1 Tax=Aeoliella straminimaris TaxID=2954799 RepID=A0A9X2FGS5_9BACT|nr:hypothetical protein [Aeoliella straminimaris]MCO6044011.1 hypothetical protein [Aeoliella straminimaris]
MSNPGKQSDEHLSEELVAYLDGELSATDSEAVESRIQSDEHARSELQKFDRVWNALDGLPRVTVDDSFTRTTIEMATVEAKKELEHETAMLPIRRRNRWLKTAAMTAAAALVGFIALLVLTPNRNRELYTNLPVILELDAYSEVRDIEFLRLLDAEAGDWLVDEWGGQVEGEAQQLALVSSASYNERRQFVNSLSSKEQADLASKHRRFQSFAPEMRDELNRWHTTLAADKDADRMQRVLLAYYAWLSQQDEMEQAQLRIKDAPERIAELKRIRDRSIRDDFFHLSPADAAALRAAVDEIGGDSQMQQLRQAMIESLPDEDDYDQRFEQRWIKGLNSCSKSSPRRPVQLTMFISATGHSEFLGQDFSKYQQAIEDRLIESLDEKTQEKLQNVPKDKPLGKTRLLTGWLFEASRGQRNPDVATLEEFFINGDLTDETRQQLLAMPREEMLEKLEQLYVEEFLGEEGMRGGFKEMMPGFGRGRWGGRGPGDRGPNDRGREDRGPDNRGPRDRGERQRGDRDGRDGGERHGPEGPPGDRLGPPPHERDGFGPPPPRPEASHSQPPN